MLPLATDIFLALKNCSTFKIKKKKLQTNKNLKTDTIQLHFLETYFSYFSPLFMRLHTKHIRECRVEDGRFSAAATNTATSPKDWL